MSQPRAPSFYWGELIWVRFGSFGRQLARVLTVTRTGNVRVCKWSMNSRRWTKPVTITRAAVLYKAQGGFPFLDLPLGPPARRPEPGMVAHPELSEEA